MKKIAKPKPIKSKNYRLHVDINYKNTGQTGYWWSIRGGNKKTRKIVQYAIQSFIEKIKKINNEIK